MLKTVMKAIVTAAMLCLLPSVAMAEVERVDTAWLEANLDNADVVVVDARRGPDWENSDRKIVGAVRIDPSDVDAASAMLPRDRQLILYCA